MKSSIHFTQNEVNFTLFVFTALRYSPKYKGCCEVFLLTKWS